MKCKRPVVRIGGQAVLEGVMMKNGDAVAIAVRKPNGKIAIETEEYHGILHGSVLMKVPIIRGSLQLIDSMILGTKSLNYSASFYDKEETKDSKIMNTIDKLTSGNADKIVSGMTIAISVIIALFIFMLLPYFISSLLKSVVRNDSVRVLIEGIIRIAIFLIYVIAISAMKDIKRVYQYHGAEHKCINCIEMGRPLNTKGVRRSSRIHKRCGTSFLLFVMLISVILFIVIRVEDPFLKIGLRILLIPVIAGISYEIIKLAGRSDNIIVKIISAPGMLLQRLTTREPDDDMIEVAIKSVEAVFDWKNYQKEQFGYDIDDAWLAEEEEVTDEYGRDEYK